MTYIHFPLNHPYEGYLLLELSPLGPEKRGNFTQIPNFGFETLITLKV